MPRHIQPRAKNGWRVVGPGGGGAQFHPAISFHDDRDMFIMCDMSGWYRSDNAGESFVQGSWGIYANAVVYDPTNPKRLWGCSTGLMRSDDGGILWRRMLPSPEHTTSERRNHFTGEAILQYQAPDYPGGHVALMAVNPDNPRHITAIVGHGAYMMEDKLGLWLYESRDDGENFTILSKQIPGETVHCMKIFTQDGKPYLYAATDQKILRWDFAVGALEEIPLPPDTTGVAAFDMGRADGDVVGYCMAVLPDGSVDMWRWQSGWQHKPLGFHPPKPGFTNGRFIGCCANAADTCYISVFRYAPYAKANQYEGVMKTTDGGDTWQWVMACTEDYPDNVQLGWMDIEYGIEWPEPPIGIGVAPNNPDVAVYTTLGSSHRSDDGGKNWRCLYSAMTTEGASTTRGLDVTTCYGYHYSPHDANQRMISYTDIGCSRSQDGGISWFPAMKGVPHSWVNTCYWLEYDPDIKGRVYSCWSSKHDLPLDKMFLQDTWFEANYGGMCISDDDGCTWRPTLQGLCTSHFVIDFATAANQRTIYAAMTGKGVYKSTDSGETWTPCNRGLPEENYAYRLTLADGKLYLITVRVHGATRNIPGKLYVSDDGAASWREIALPGDIQAPCDIEANPWRGGVYLVARPYEQEDQGDSGLYYAADGEHFAKLPFPLIYPHNISFDPNTPGRIFLSTFENSLMRSDDQGQTWHRIAGFNFRAAHKVTIDPLDPTHLYIACFGSSVWHGPIMGNGQPHEDVLP